MGIDLKENLSLSLRKNFDIYVPENNAIECCCIIFVHPQTVKLRNYVGDI